MKRHKKLISLSQEHHTTLSLINRILKNKGVNYAQELINHRPLLLAHFKEEEEIFGPLWNKDLDSLKIRFEQEHSELRELLSKLNENYECKELALYLRAHIRFEERILFSEIEKLL